MAKDLYDERNVNDKFRSRITSLEEELATKNELLGNLRHENDLLEEIKNKAMAELDRLAEGQAFTDLTIVGPKLPEALDNALKHFADAHPGQVVYDPANGTMRWKADLLFALGSDVVKESSLESLRGFSEVIKSPAAENFEVLVVGHTDTVPISPQTKPKHPTNWHLSAHRAIAVANVLLGSGYHPQRVSVMGCGEHRPAVSDQGRSGTAENRRVDIYLIRSGSIVPVSTASLPIISGEALAAAPAIP